MAYDAVELFVKRAQRVRPDFSLQEAESAVARICHLVGGMPLALELAATWIRVLPCSEIVVEMERNAGFLSTSLRNVTERHRSMQAVFEHSWHLLRPDERALFQQLSIFRGGFSRQAAEVVAGASLPLLSALLDKSMLRRSANGRYQIHELLRQFGERKLDESGSAAQATRDRHCHYYMSFLHERLPRVNDRRQQQAAAEIGTELDNVRAGWAWAVLGGDVQALAQGVSTYFYFCQLQSRYLESAEALADAVDSLRKAAPSPERDFTLTRALTHQGWMRIRLGEFERAGKLLEESREIYAQLQRDPLPYMGTDPATPLAIVALIRGDHERAVALGEEARAAAAAREDRHNLSFAHYVLIAARLAQGRYEAAYAHAETACQLAHAVGNDWFLPYPLNEWGNVARAMGNIAEARQHFQASLKLKEAFNDAEGVAVALNHLGEIALLQADYETAQRLFQRGLALYQDLADRGGRATSLKGLGQASAAQGDCETARRQFGRALAIATEIRFWPLVFAVFVDVGALLRQMGSASLAIELLALVQGHAASNQELKARATAQVEQWRKQAPPELVAEAERRGMRRDVSAAIAALQAALDAPVREVESDSKVEMVKAEQPLIEPLTSRELDVLQLLAAGQTNAQIAAELVIALGTAKWYASQIYGKLGVANRTEAAMRARELGLLGGG